MGMIYDVIVIGIGPAGLTAALYAARRSLKVLVIGEILGGQSMLPACVENFPGVGKTDGPTLVRTWRDQAVTAGAELKAGVVVTRVEPQGTLWGVKASSGEEYQAKAMILALGRTPRKLDILGEQEFTGKGVAYCATCDAPLFAGKDVAVIGGGSVAVDAALLLSQFASKTYLIHRHDKFKAEDIALQKLAHAPIEVLTYAEVREIAGSSLVEKIKIKNTKDNTYRDLPVQGVFIEIGGDTNSDLVKDLVKLNELSEIVINGYNQTSVSGIFAAGDVTTVPYKQMVIAAGEGAKAALSAYHYLQTKI